MSILLVVLFSVVEGLTEFLPVSSTAHLMLVSKIFGMEKDEFVKSFEIAIQLGAILSVVFLYRERLYRDLEVYKRIFLSFLPTALVGFTLYKLIKGFLLQTLWISGITLVLGGLVFLFIEELLGKPKYHDPSQIPMKVALTVGLFQSLAVVPGVSRAGATIVGCMLLGMDKRSATEYSFLLAIPTMFSATFYDLFKSQEFLMGRWDYLILGLSLSFLFALLSVKGFLKFISTHSFRPFGIYRIVLGALILIFYEAL